MRVRYQMVGQSGWSAECDLTEKKARALYEKLKTKGFCEWGELVGEDDDNYMDVLESFDHIKLARSLHKIVGELCGK